MSRNHDPLAGSGGLATPSRRDNRSGLIDIRALSSLVDAHGGRSPSPTASSLALPTFAAPWTQQDTSALPTVATPPPTIAVPAEDNLSLYLMIVALSVAVLSLGVFVVLHQPSPVVIEAPVSAVVLADPLAVSSAGPPEPGKPRPSPPAEPIQAPLAVAPPSESEPQSSDEPRARPSRNSRASRSHRTTRARRQAEAKPKLPSTPGSSQIRAAIAAVKPRAKACATRSGANRGDTVRIKLSVTGHNGRVTRARALDDHAGTALGRCVAEALSRATLPRFSKARAGIVYSIRM